MLCSRKFLKELSPLLGFRCSFVIDSINPHHSRFLQTDTLVNSEDPDEVKHYAPLIRACTV